MLVKIIGVFNEYMLTISKSGLNTFFCFNIFFDKLKVNGFENINNGLQKKLSKTLRIYNHFLYLCKIAYSDLEKQERISIQSLRTNKKLFELSYSKHLYNFYVLFKKSVNTPEEYKIWIKENRQNIIKKIFKKIKLVDLKKVKNFGYDLELQIEDENTGFSMTIVSKNVGLQKNYIFCIRGTNDLKDVVYSNNDMLNGELPLQIVSLINAFLYNSKVKSIINSNTIIDIVGHSLGGSLALIAGIIFDKRINKVYTFNAPGVIQLEGINEKYLGEIVNLKLLKSVKHYVEIFEKNKIKKTFKDNPQFINFKNKDVIGNYGQKIGREIYSDMLSMSHSMDLLHK